MPRSFLVKKNRPWHKMYRRLQWSIAQTAYKPEDIPPKQICLPSSPPVAKTVVEPLKPVITQPCCDNHIPTSHPPSIIHPPVLLPFGNVFFPPSDLFSFYGYETDNIYQPSLKTFPMKMSPPHSMNYSSSTSDDENLSPLQSPSKSLGSDGETATPNNSLRDVLKERKTTKGGKLSCPDCGKVYCTGGGLNKHRQTLCRARQVGKTFKCKHCPKEYNALGALKMHLRTHTLPCKCGLCGKAFSRPWLLQGHIRTHTGEKPFSCQHCQRAFADRSNLRAHLQTHSDVKRYSCSRCMRTFSRMSLLQKHKESGSCGHS